MQADDHRSICNWTTDVILAFEKHAWSSMIFRFNVWRHRDPQRASTLSQSVDRLICRQYHWLLTISVPAGIGEQNIDGLTFNHRPIDI